MKRVILGMFVAIMGMATGYAQQIAVVTGSSTRTYQTLKQAIEGASNGSVIYLPGGGFQIGDTVKITKRVTIMGIGHKPQSENADGNTVISGNLFFNEGSSNSAVLGCYISGNVIIGEGGSSVNNILVKYCNLNAMDVRNNTCTGIVINQNYIRNTSVFNNSNVTIKNNVLHSVGRIHGGIISNNILTSFRYEPSGADVALRNVENSTISYNIILDSRIHTGSNCTVYGNMARSNFGDDCVACAADANDLFQKYLGITPASIFAFQEQFEANSNIGIYGGTGFSDGALPPVPYVVEKMIPEQTDASGKLNIRLKVKASEE